MIVEWFFILYTVHAGQLVGPHLTQAQCEAVRVEAYAQVKRDGFGRVFWDDLKCFPVTRPK